MDSLSNSIHRSCASLISSGGPEYTTSSSGGLSSGGRKVTLFLGGRAEGSGAVSWDFLVMSLKDLSFLGFWAMGQSYPVLLSGAGHPGVLVVPQPALDANPADSAVHELDDGDPFVFALTAVETGHERLLPAAVGMKSKGLPTEASRRSFSRTSGGKADWLVCWKDSSGLAQ